MAKNHAIGLSNYESKKRIRRKGRHKKNINKSKKVKRHFC